MAERAKENGELIVIKAVFCRGPHTDSKDVSLTWGLGPLEMP